MIRKNLGNLLLNQFFFFVKHLQHLNFGSCWLTKKLWLAVYIFQLTVLYRQFLEEVCYDNAMQNNFQFFLWFFHKNNLLHLELKHWHCFLPRIFCNPNSGNFFHLMTGTYYIKLWKISSSKLSNKQKKVLIIDIIPTLLWIHMKILLSFFQSLSFWEFASKIWIPYSFTLVFYRLYGIFSKQRKWVSSCSTLRHIYKAGKFICS